MPMSISSCGRGIVMAMPSLLEPLPADLLRAVRRIPGYPVPITVHARDVLGDDA